MSGTVDYESFLTELKRKYKFNIKDGVLYSRTWCDGGILYKINGVKEIVHKENSVNIKNLYKKIISLIADPKITANQKDSLYIKYVHLLRLVDEYGYPGTRIYLLKYKIEIEDMMNELTALGLLKIV